MDRLIERVVARYPKKYRDDLAQDCQLKLLTLKAPSPIPQNKKGYYYTILKNLCIDHLKALRGGYELTLDKPTLDDEGEVTGAIIDCIEGHGQVDYEVSQGEVIDLYLMGHGAKEIATKVGQSKRTIQRKIKAWQLRQEQ